MPSQQRKRKSEAPQDALASPLQPGNVSADTSIEQQQQQPQQRRQRTAQSAIRPNEYVTNRPYLLWRAVNREKHLEALNEETTRVLSEWTSGPSLDASSQPRGRNLDVAEYLRAAKEIENHYGGPSGELVTFGNNESSQLGIPELLDEKTKFVYPPRRVTLLRGPVRHFACGGLHNAALLENGHVMTWGCGDDGALGRPVVGDDSEPRPTYVTGFFSKNGNQEDGQIISVSAGDSHTLYLSQNGNVYMTGMYKDSDSGIFHDVVSPTDSPAGSNLDPVHVWLLPQNVMQIYSRGGFNAAMLSDRSLVTWGFGNSGELARSADMISLNEKGVFDLKKVHVNTSDGEYNHDFIREKFLKPSPVRYSMGSPKKTVLTAACGTSHLLVVAREPNGFQSTLYSSGMNNYGQLGTGDLVERHELTPVTALKDTNIGQVAAGLMHSLCVTLTGSQVYSWGREDYGQLGLGASTTAGAFKSTPTIVKFPALEGPRVHLFTEIACGDHTSMALTADHDLYTWGYEGTTGHGKFAHKDLNLPKKLEVNDSLQKRDPGTTAVVHKIGSGGQHCAILVKRYTNNAA